MAIKLHSSVKVAIAMRLAARTSSPLPSTGVAEQGLAMDVNVRIHRRSLHQITFVAAGVYNVAWAWYTALDPQWLFRFADMSPMRYPEDFACLAMVIGLYGILYWRLAWRPEDGKWIAAVGLAGKILGPLGYGVLVVRGVCPLHRVVLILTNDVVACAPFALYLLDASRARQCGFGTERPHQQERNSFS